MTGGTGSVLKLTRTSVPERAERPDEEFADVVAGDVLDDHPAGVRERAVGERGGRADDQIARAAVRAAARPEPAGGQRAADASRARGCGASNGKNWPCARERVRRARRASMPASTPIVRSRGSYSATAPSARGRRARRRSAAAALPSDCSVPPPCTTAATPASSQRRCRVASACASAGDATLGIFPPIANSAAATTVPASPASTPAACRFGAHEATATGVSHFAADRAGREDLVGIEAPLRVEHVAHAAHRRQVVGAEHQRQRLALLVADPVLAADRSAHRDARRRESRVPASTTACDLRGCRAGRRASADAGCRRRHGRRCRPCSRDSRAIASIAADRLGQFRARHARVLDVVVRRDAADRAGRAFARPPTARRVRPASRAARHESAPHCRAIAAIAASLASMSSAKPATSTSSTAPASAG